MNFSDEDNGYGIEGRFRGSEVEPCNRVENVVLHYQCPELGRQLGPVCLYVIPVSLKQTH